MKGNILETLVEKMPKINMGAIKMFGKKNAPALCCVGGILTLTGAIVSLMGAVKNAREDLDAFLAEETTPEADITVKDVPVKDKIKITWKRFIPGALLYVGGVTLIVAGQKISLARLAAISGLLKLRGKEIGDLKETLKEKVGLKEATEIEKEAHHADVVAAMENGVVNTGHGTTYFFDPMSGTVFQSSIWHVQRALNHMIEAVKIENYYTLDELYMDLDFPIKPSCGEYFAFKYSKNRDLQIDSTDGIFEYHSMPGDKGDSRPCIYLNYINRLDPSYEFERDIAYGSSSY